MLPESDEPFEIGSLGVEDTEPELIAVRVLEARWQ